MGDAGVWTWWADRFPEHFQLEFNQTMLWMPPRSEGLPPDHQLGIRFIEPSFVCFLTFGDVSDWKQQLHEDRLQPLPIRHDRISFRNDEVKAILQSAPVKEIAFGCEPDWPAVPVCLAFQASQFGICVASRGIALLAGPGGVPMSEVKSMHEKFWPYWREYWARVNTPGALPHDPICAVTIPLDYECKTEEEATRFKKLFRRPS